jgi:hypothetical protein
VARPDDDAADGVIIAAAIARSRGERPERSVEPERVRRVEHVIDAIIEARGSSG